MKCPKCKLDLNEDAFAKNRTRKNGHSSYCKKCNKTIKDKHYNNNKIDYKNKVDNRRSVIKNYILDIKKKSKCKFCDENHISCLQFHHLDKNEKDFSISDVTQLGVSIEKVNLELEKCIIVCSNCHFKLHYNESHYESGESAGLSSQ
jgi:hypothetical protein